MTETETQAVREWRETDEEWSYRIIAGDSNAEHLHLTAEYVNLLERKAALLDRYDAALDVILRELGSPVHWAPEGHYIDELRAEYEALK